jgi:HlyD family secretion protein
LPAALLALALLLSGCGRDGGSDGATAETKLAPTRAATPITEVRQVVTADGLLVLPVPAQALSFPAASTVLEVAVQPGERVEKGQILARIDVLPLDQALAQARASQATAQQRLDDLLRGPETSDIQTANADILTASAAVEALQSGAALESARLEVERAKNTLWGAQAERDSICGLVEEGFAEQSRCDSAQASVQAGENAVRIAEQHLAEARSTASDDLAAAQSRLAAARARLGQLRAGPTSSELEAARAQLDQADRALDQARADWDRAVMRAPFTGQVEEVSIAEGVMVSPAQPAITLVVSDALRFATTNLSERNVADVTEGVAAVVVLAAFPDTPLQGVVQRIAPVAGTQAGATVFTVYLDVENPDGLPLRAGMTGRVEIQID